MLSVGYYQIKYYLYFSKILILFCLVRSPSLFERNPGVIATIGQEASRLSHGQASLTLCSLSGLHNTPVAILGGRNYITQP